jgi:hypothetical protein
MNKKEPNLILLERIQTHLEKSGIETVLLDKAQYEMYVHIPSDRKGRERTITLSPYELEENELQKSNIFLQIYSQVPVQLSTEQMATATMLIPEINLQMAIGHFGVQYHMNCMYFKYILLLSDEEPQLEQKIEEVLHLTEFSLDMLSPTIDLIEKGLNLEEIKNVA